MKGILKLLALVLCLSGLTAAAQLPPGTVVSKIWSRAPHSAFTDLVYFRGKFYCSFRESDTHVFGNNGVIRILSSKDGASWQPEAVLKKQDCDLRDPKLSVTPNGRLMVLIGGSFYEGRELKGRHPQVSFLTAAGFSEPRPVELPDGVKTDADWLWRVTWHKKTGYGVIYQLGAQWKILLLKTLDGVRYELVTALDVPDKPNETTLRIMPDGEMLMMVRREGGDKKGYWGRSRYPYRQWRWTSLGFSLGGPDFIALNDSLLLAGSRAFDSKGPYTALMLGNRAGVFRKILHLPSGGDTGYPGLVIQGDDLFASYYSSHEGSTAVYLARIPLTEIKSFITAPPMARTEKIWEVKDRHCAFTDIARFNHFFYCVFREATGHVPGEKGEDGKIRVIRSADGVKWESVALISEERIDLRDPKLSVMPGGKLMITCGGSDYDGPALKEWHSRVMYSANGTNWTAPMRVRGIPSNNWFFRLTWFGNNGYVAANICRSDPATGNVITNHRQLVVFSTTDGLNYKQVSNDMAPDTLACEATIRFKNDSTMAVFIRNAHGKDQQWSTVSFSRPPYREYRPVKIDHGLGGPNVLQLDNGEWLIGTREYPFERPPGRGGYGTVLLTAGDDGIYRRALELPAGGNDTGYPGMLIADGKLWVSYYSSHEDHTAVYLSVVPLDELRQSN